MDCSIALVFENDSLITEILSNFTRLYPEDKLHYKSIIEVSSSLMPEKCTKFQCSMKTVKDPELYKKEVWGKTVLSVALLMRLLLKLTVN